MKVAFWSRTLAFTLIGFAHGVACQGGYAEELRFRTFTNQSGAVLNAALLEFVEGGKVKIQREADAKIFEIPIQSLSPEDQAYLKLESARREQERAASSGIGRESLTVHGSYLGDRIGAFNGFANKEETEIGAKSFLLTPAIGSWLCYQPYELGKEFLVQYHGAETWRFDVQDRVVWLTRDSNAPEIVGVAFPSDGDAARDLLRGLDKSKIAEVLSIGISGDENLEELEVLSSDIPLAISSTTTVDDRTFERLGNENVVALHVRLTMAGLPSLSKFTNLRYLGLKIYDVPDGEVISLPEIPSLEHLLVVDIVGQLNWDELLGQFSQLESLVTVKQGKSYQPVGTPITSFSANPELKTLSLYHNSHQYLDRRALKTVLKLENLRLSSEVLLKEEEEDSVSEEPSEESVPEVERGVLDYMDHLLLRRLYLTDSEVSQEAFDEWSATGALKELRSFTGYVVPKAELVPKLEEYAHLRRIQDQNKEFDFSPMNGAENLRSLSLTRAMDEEMATLKLVRPEQLRNFRLALGYLTDPEWLFQFTGLKYLKMVRNDGNLEQLDLDRLPELEYLNLASCANIEGFANVASHGNLQHLWLSSANYFSDFGAASPNDTLEKLMLSNLPRLESVAAFNETSKMWRLDIRNCDKVATYEEVRDGNDGMYYLAIEGNSLLEDVQQFPIRD